MQADMNAETCVRRAVILSKNSSPVPERGASAIISRRTSNCSGEQMKFRKLLPKSNSATAGSAPDALEVLQSPRHVVFRGRHHAFDEQFFLRGEVTVDRCLGTADLRGDFRNRGLIEALRPEQAEGGVQDGLPLAVSLLHVCVAFNLLQ